MVKLPITRVMSDYKNHVQTGSTQLISNDVLVLYQNVSFPLGSGRLKLRF